MAEHRTYDEDEIRQILEIAAQSQAVAPGPAAGLTLVELQRIAAEVGIEPAAVARAAASIAVTVPALRGTSLGLPVDVGRTVALPRAPTDEEWQQIVAEARATFGARGRLAQEPGARQWWNGNLQVAVERAPGGHRLRLLTSKGDARPLSLMGASGVAAGTAIAAVLAATGGLGEALVGPLMIAGAGAAALLANVVRLPRWARTREAQMEHLADQTLAILGSPPGPA